MDEYKRFEPIGSTHEEMVMPAMVLESESDNAEDAETPVCDLEQEEHEISRYLCSIFEVDCNDLPTILASLVPRMRYDMINPDHVMCVMSSLVNVHPAGHEICLTFLHHVFANITESRLIAANKPFIELLVAYLKHEQWYPLIPLVFSILEKLFETPSEQLVTLTFETSLFDVLNSFIDIENDTPIAGFSSNIMRLISANQCISDNAAVSVFLNALIDALCASRDLSDPQVHVNIFQALIEVHNHDVRFEQYVNEEQVKNLIESLTCFLTPNNSAEDCISALKVLANLCLSGAKLLENMRDFGTIGLVRDALLSRNSNIAYAALVFFEKWCSSTDEHRRYQIFDQLCWAADQSFNWVLELSQVLLYTAKRETMNMILLMAQYAKPVYVVKMITPEVLDCAIGQLDCMGDQAISTLCQAIQACGQRCSGNQEYIESIRQVLVEAEFDDDMEPLRDQFLACLM